MQRHDGRRTERQEDRDRLAWRRRGNKNRKLEIKVEKISAHLWAKFLSLSPSLSLSHIHALSLSLSLSLSHPFSLFLPPCSACPHCCLSTFPRNTFNSGKGRRSSSSMMMLTTMMMHRRARLELSQFPRCHWGCFLKPSSS